MAVSMKRALLAVAAIVALWCCCSAQLTAGSECGVGDCPGHDKDSVFLKHLVAKEKEYNEVKKAALEASKQVVLEHEATKKKKTALVAVSTLTVLMGIASGVLMATAFRKLTNSQA